MHQFKPKMTGGVDQSAIGISPEAHKEWSKKGKVSPASMKPAPAPVPPKGKAIANESKQHAQEVKSDTAQKTFKKQVTPDQKKAVLGLPKMKPGFGNGKKGAL
jgi:hypothetical protein